MTGGLRDSITVVNPPADGDRCQMNDGKTWRCRLPRLGGSRFCEKHHLQHLPRRPNTHPVFKTGVRVSDAPIEKRGSPKGTSDVRASEPLIGKKRRPIEEDDFELRSEGEDSEWEIEEEVEEEERGASRVRVSNTSSERKKRGRPPKRKEAERVSNVKARVMFPEPLMEEKSIEDSNRVFGGDEDSKEWQIKEDEVDWDTSRVRVPCPSVLGKRKGIERIGGVRVSGDPSIQKGRSVGRPTTNAAAIEDLKLGQVWAYSTESDGFPRSYARIDHIDRNQSFVQLTVTPLVPHLILPEEDTFAEQGLPLACGLFKTSKSTVTKKFSDLARNVLFEKEGKHSSYFRVFPRRGEIWAVYLEWDKGSYSYVFVEVASDFDEDDGVNVYRLIGVEGQAGVYRRQVHEGFYLVKRCSRSFMPMFSHRVPASRIVEDGQMLWKVNML